MSATGNRLPNCSACGLQHPPVPHPLAKSLKVQSGFMYQIESLTGDVSQQAELTNSLHMQLTESSNAPQVEEVPEDRDQDIADAPLPAASS
eukprot:1876008-Karenia_brevis.AAC.1